MKYRNILIGFTSALLFSAGIMTNVSAGDLQADQAEASEAQDRFEAEYEKAMAEVERQRLDAEASIEKAREQLELANQQRQFTGQQRTEAQAARQAEMAKMHEELNRARRELQETSREIARVNRELTRARSAGNTSNFVIRTSERPVIGVILGNVQNGGVEVLGVSPDGPSERAGIRPGDIIHAVDGRELSTIDKSGDAKDALQLALKDIKADKPVMVSLKRKDEKVDVTVVPEIREPMNWQMITRFPTAPAAPAAPGRPGAPRAPEKVITIENIVVPEIDTVAMAEQIEQMRAGIEQRRALREAARVTPGDGEWEIEFDELSELGSLALEDANVWFGLPLAQGLQLAEINPGLGTYFKTDRGVLVLKAPTGNDLQLEPGDVILQVGETEVNTPADFMRALRGFDSGDELVLDIKRSRKDRTLKTIMPEGRTGFFQRGDGKTRIYTITSSSH